MRFRVAVFALVLTMELPRGLAQVGTEPSPLAFDVASVRQNKSEGWQGSNVPLGPGDVYAPTGGVLTARDMSLTAYIYFAYDMTVAQLEFFVKQAPGWVLDGFDISAKTDKPDVTKAEMRLMMRALLSERFGLAFHSEVREIPIYELLMVKPGQMGPGLRVHPAGIACAAVGNDVWPARNLTTIQTIEGGFVSYCGGITALHAAGRGNRRFGASRVSMKLIANHLASWGGLGKAVVDRTGLTGNYDFVLEYAPLGAPDKEAEAVGPPFVEALKKAVGATVGIGEGTSGTAGARPY